MVLSAGTWHFNNLTAATGSPVIGSDELRDGPALDAYAFEGQGTQHVVYGSFPGIHELWWAGIIAPASSAAIPSQIP